MVLFPSFVPQNRCAPQPPNLGLLTGASWWISAGVPDTAFCAVARLVNDCFSPAYASRDLIKDLGNFVALVNDKQSDIWAAGVMSQ